MVRVKLELISQGVVAMRFSGKSRAVDDAERSSSLLAPSCEFDHRSGRWTFPLQYLVDVGKILQKYADKVAVSSNVVKAFRLQQKTARIVRALQAKPTSFFPATPYEAIFKAECMPYPYQRQGVAIMLAAKRLLLADSVGLGKTIQSVATIAMALKSGVCRRAMVVTTAGVKGQWREEALKYLQPDAIEGLANGFVVIGGDRAKRLEAYNNPANRVLVLNYELFLHDLRIMPPVGMVLLDEAAKIKSLDAKTTQNIRVYCAKHRVRYRYALTATAIENRLEDFFSILLFLNDRSLGFHTYFMYHYCKRRQFRAPNGRRITQVIGHLNLDEAKRRTAHVLLRRTKDDVGTELPELIVRNVAVNLGPLQRKKYEQVKVEAKDPDSDLDPLQRSRLLREVCDSLALVESGATESAKLDELEHFVRNVIGPDHSLVIFTQWQRMAKLIVERLAPCYEQRPRVISGQVKSQDRDRHRQDFNEEKYRCLVMTDAGKAGLNLQACETMVNFELPWNPATLKQRIGRMHRAGQQHKVTTVINFITNNTIEHRVAERLMRRHRVFDTVLTAAEDELQAMDFSKTLTMSDLMELA